MMTRYPQDVYTKMVAKINGVGLLDVTDLQRRRAAEVIRDLEYSQVPPIDIVWKGELTRSLLNS